MICILIVPWRMNEKDVTVNTHSGYLCGFNPCIISPRLFSFLLFEIFNSPCLICSPWVNIFLKFYSVGKILVFQNRLFSLIFPFFLLPENYHFFIGQGIAIIQYKNHLLIVFFSFSK